MAIESGNIDVLFDFAIQWNDKYCSHHKSY